MPPLFAPHTDIETLYQLEVTDCINLHITRNTYISNYFLVNQSTSLLIDLLKKKGRREERKKAKSS